MAQPNPDSEHAEKLLDIASAYWVSRSLHVVADLGLADILAEKPMSPEELAEAVGVHGPSLSRVLRLLASYGVFERTAAGTYRHSNLSRILRKDHPHSAHNFVRMYGADINWDSYKLMHHSVRTGKPARAELIEGDFFADYLPQHPDLAELFNASMTSRAHIVVKDIHASYDYSGFKVIGDIGGGNGHLLRSILEQVTDARGVLFDVPTTIARAPDSNRLEKVGGDFFKDDIPRCDLYLMMSILHDWSDEECVKILHNVHRSAKKGAKLQVIECIVPEEPGPHWAKRLDIHMLTALTGRERTGTEFDALLQSGGFLMDHIIPTPGRFSIIEATIDK